jgi:hypothetical protein
MTIEKLSRISYRIFNALGFLGLSDAPATAHTVASAALSIYLVHIVSLQNPLRRTGLLASTGASDQPHGDTLK